MHVVHDVDGGEWNDGGEGRDHNGGVFAGWMCGAGVKPGFTYGATEEIASTVTENKVHVHDLNATILHLLGFDHTKLTYRFQGRDFRLTDVHGELVTKLLDDHLSNRELLFLRGGVDHGHLVGARLGVATHTPRRATAYPSGRS